MVDATIVHIAGIAVPNETVTRQRCAWCGMVLVEWDSLGASVAGPDPWPVGALVAKSGMQWQVGEFVAPSDPTGVAGMADVEDNAGRLLAGSCLMRETN